MKIVYIAGPYGDAGGYLAIDANIAKAREAAAWLISYGVGFICPHLNSAHFEVIAPGVPVERWYELDLALMRAADALLVLEGWTLSKGTQAEIVEWEKTGKPIYYAGCGDESLLIEWARS